MNNIAEKLLAAGISLAGGYVGTKVVEGTWKAVTGNDAPSDPDDAENPVVQAIVFATISAGISTAIRIASNRGAHKAIARFNDRKAERLATQEV